MKIEIGVDIIENSRFDSDILFNTSFLNKFFSSREQSYCLTQSNPSEHFASRFAAKEAVVKALYGFGIKARLLNVEIVLDDNNIPKVYLVNLDADLSELDIKVSLSHSDKLSIAFVVISQTENYSFI